MIFEKRYLGNRYGRLTVIGIVPDRKPGRCVDLLCRCDCGNTKTISAAGINLGTTISCGCYHRERLIEAVRKAGTTHGGTVNGVLERTYSIWQCMRQRCSNKRQKPYKNYGGRGISVCQEWQNDYAAFREWALSNGYRDDLTIDRINNDGNYEPGNCRWATYHEQARNRRKPQRREING